MSQLKLNPITGKLDLVGMTDAEVSAYLKLDQTVPQSISNGSPEFNAGLIIKAGQKLYFDGE